MYLKKFDYKCWVYAMSNLFKMTANKRFAAGSVLDVVLISAIYVT